MARQTIERLLKDYEFEHSHQYYDYIIDSYINGQRQQAANLFNQMQKFHQRFFMKQHLQPDADIDQSVLNMCIDELTS